MLDIRTELKIALAKRGTSMRKVIEKTRFSGLDIPNASTLSSQLINQRIRFKTVQDLLDYLGFELVIKEK